MKTPLSVVILVKNEELNLPHVLGNVRDWAAEVFVVELGSTDRTVEVATQHGATVVRHLLKGYEYAEPRNWALRNLPFAHEWVVFIDTDEYPTEALKKEIGEVIRRNPEENGFYMKRRFIFWGKWIKHGGYYPVWILRLMRHKAARCEGMLMDEHFAVEGKTGRLVHDLMHDDHRGFRDWVNKHRRFAELKARERIAGRSVEAPTGDDAASRERAAKRQAWDKLPLFVRPFLYWGYVMFVRGGILDGIPGIVYHTLRGFWYPFLIDRNICRLKCAARKP